MVLTMDFNLKNTTFIIPVRIDSEDRLANLDLIIIYLKSFLDTNIFILENASEPILENRYNKIKYKFEYDCGLFHRTKILNNMVKDIETPYFVNYDCDVLFKAENYLKAHQLLENGYDMVYPYDGHFLDIDREKYRNQILKNNLNNIDGIYLSTLSYGGAIFLNTNSFKECGMENENFVSWSPEDAERFKRFKKLNKKIIRINGTLYHLNHSRGIDSSIDNPKYKQGLDEENKILLMNQNELKNYIKTWKWIN